MIAYMFQVYNIVIWHLYIIQCTHYMKSHNHLSLQSCHLLATFFFTIPPPPALCQLSVFSLCFYESVWVLFCLFICFYFFKSTYKWNQMAFVFLCLTYFTLHNTVYIHPHCGKWQVLGFFLLSKLLCICVCVSRKYSSCNNGIFIMKKDKLTDECFKF